MLLVGDGDGDVQEIDVLLADATRLALAVGDRATASEIAARAEALPYQEDVPHRAAIAQYCRGLLDADPSVLLQAADTYEKARRPLPQAQALEAAAALLAERDGAAAARAPITAALGIYTRLGAEWDLTRARAWFRAHGMMAKVRRPRRPATANATDPPGPVVVGANLSQRPAPVVRERFACWPVRRKAGRRRQVSSGNAGGSAPTRRGTMTAEALCRRWHLPLRNPGRSPPGASIAEALCRGKGG